jgi:hypothetical protein
VHAAEACTLPFKARGLCGQLAAEATAEAQRLSAVAAEALAGGPGLERAELAVRAAVLELGRVVLEPLLAADTGYAGPRAECGRGHQARFVAYRDKTVDTVLGPVALRRAWYHCAWCKRGFAPRDAHLGIAGMTMSPGLAAMTDRAAAALPFAAAAGLAGELAGITLTGERARRRGAAHVRQLVFLGDGAAWIWNLATRHFPQATAIVDLYHAREHLHDLAKLLEFMLGDHKQAWLEQRLAELDGGDIDAISAAARAFPLAGRKARDLDTALGYFEHNAHRMRYADFKSLGMFIGSGAVEAGCKTIVAQRCQLSGMRWTTPGATGILTLRCLEASNRWQQIPAHPGQARQPEPVWPALPQPDAKATPGY